MTCLYMIADSVTMRQPKPYLSFDNLNKMAISVKKN